MVEDPGGGALLSGGVRDLIAVKPTPFARSRARD